MQASHHVLAQHWRIETPILSILLLNVIPAKKTTGLWWDWYSNLGMQMLHKGGGRVQGPESKHPVKTQIVVS